MSSTCFMIPSSGSFVAPSSAAERDYDEDNDNMADEEDQENCNPNVAQKGNAYQLQHYASIENLSEEEIYDKTEEYLSSLSSSPLSLLSCWSALDWLISLTAQFAAVPHESQMAVCEHIMKAAEKCMAAVEQYRAASNNNNNTNVKSTSASNKRSSDSFHFDAPSAASLNQHVKLYVYTMCEIIKNIEHFNASNSSKCESGEHHDDDDVDKPMKRGGAKKSNNKKGHKKQSSTASIINIKEKMLGLVVDILKNKKLSCVWKMNTPDEDLGLYLSSTFLSLLSSASSSSQSAIFSVLHSVVCLWNVAGTIVSNMIHSLYTDEALAIKYADLCEQGIHVNESRYTLFISELLCEISKLDMNFLNKDVNIARNISTFLIEITARLPYIVVHNLAVLETHLDGESYMLRNGVVQLIGQLLEKGFVAPPSSSATSAPSKSKTTKSSRRRKHNDDDDDEESDEDEAEDDDEQQESDANKDKADKSSPTMSDETQLKMRTKLFQILEQRIHDVNSFTRCKVLQTFIQLLRAKNVIQQQQYPLLYMIALDRITDKASNVRKYAVQLMTTLMEENPFSPTLNHTMFESKLHELALSFKNSILAVRPELAQTIVEEEQSAAEDKSDNAEDEKEASGNKRRSFELKHTMTDVNEEKSMKQLMLNSNELDESFQQQRLQLESLYTGVQFMQLIHNSLSICEELLNSKTNTDVLESMSFFCVAHEFNVVDSLRGVQKIMISIWSREQSIRDASIECYRRLYIGDEILTHKANSPQHKKLSLLIAQQWIELVMSSNLSTLTSLEEMITKLMYNSALPSSVIDCWWELFNTESLSVSSRTSALMCITYASNADGFIISQHLSELVSVGLGQVAVNSHMMARTACIALMKLHQFIANAPVPEKAPQLSQRTIDTIVQRVQTLLMNTNNSYKNQDLFTSYEQLLNVLFAYHAHPDAVCEEIIAQWTSLVFSPNTDSQANMAGNAELMTRLFFIVGHTALRTLVQLEAVESQIKKLKAKKTSAKQVETELALAKQQADADADEEEESNPKPKSKSKSSKQRTSDGPIQISTATSDPIDNKANSQRSAIEDELAVNASEEYELEQKREVAEKKLIDLQQYKAHQEVSLLSVYGPLLVRVILNPNQYRYERLQQSAVSALSKFMLISSDFCDRHLQLLFTLLTQSSYPIIRANSIIALGDLAFRFPNLIEPWSEYMYAGLRDTCVQVRKNTLMVLTHLILNDMLKTKGPIAELAKCIKDKETRIMELAKIFFQELNNKNKSPIYNLLPDVISRLSNDKTVSVDEFKLIFKYLLTFIQKDKQTESLVDKLIHRFDHVHIETVLMTELNLDDIKLNDDGSTHKQTMPNSNDDGKNEDQDAQAMNLIFLKQCRDIAYCLTQLNFTNVSFKKLTQLWNSYAGKVGDQEIFESFTSIIAKSRKLLKPEFKSMLDEFEEKLNAQHDKLVEDAKVTSNAKNARGKKGYGDKLEDEEMKTEAVTAHEDEEEAEEQEVKPKKKGSAKETKSKNVKASKAKSKSKRKAVSSDEEDEEEEESESDISSLDEDDDDEEEEEVVAKPAGKKPLPKAAAAKKTSAAAAAKKAPAKKSAAAAPAKKPAGRRTKKQASDDDDE